MIRRAHHANRGDLVGPRGRAGARIAAWLALPVSLLACGEAVEPLPETLPEATAAAPVARRTFDAPGAIVVAHGGQGSPASRSDGPLAAVEASWSALDHGDGLRQAAVAGIHVMEDDPRFNAGTGANLRLDGRTIECDAAIMDDEHGFGAVAGLHETQHPIDVAAAVAEGPHLLVAGEGANTLASRLAMPSRDLTTDGAKAKLRRGWSRLLSEDSSTNPWSDFGWRDQWNFATEAPLDMAQVDASLESGSDQGASEFETRDTVGVVGRDTEGRFVAALSTGGTTLALRGRVGDVPQLGHGLYAGPDGAVAATGKGEAIIRERVALEVYRQLEAGVPPDEAIRLAIRGISVEEGVGVIAVSNLGWGARATSQMAWAVKTSEGVERADGVIRTDRW